VTQSLFIISNITSDTSCLLVSLVIFWWCLQIFQYLWWHKVYFSLVILPVTQLSF